VARAIEMTRVVLRVALGMALMATPAWAVGPIVSKNCTASWGAVTTRIDGSAITGVLTYNLYIVAGTPTVAPATPSLTGITTTTYKACTVLAVGQYTAWVSATELLGGLASEGGKSPAFPFVLAPGPAVPSGLIIK
jgi:hypothetical protein